MREKIIALYGLIAILMLTISACRGNTASTIVSPTETRFATASLLKPNGTTAPPATPSKVLPEATFTRIPTFTPTYFASHRPTSQPKPKPTEDLVSRRNPLTGELVSDASFLDRRPLAIKVSNAPAKYTRPQAGLGQADLVFEHITEGSLTRFTAIIYGQTPPTIGPIRSARLVDLEILPMYDAALAYSGSSIGVAHRLFSSEFKAPIIRPHEEGYYRTGENKPYEHTLYAVPDGLWKALDVRNLNKVPSLSPLMSFSEVPPDGGLPANTAWVRYKQWTEIEWRFDSDSERYLRWVDGESHVDANNGEQISAANVVLLFVPHRYEESICEQQSGNRCLAYSVEVQLDGLGTAILLREGQRYDIFWRRYNQGEMVNLADENGNLVPMNIGNTWYQVIPLDYPEPVTIE